MGSVWWGLRAEGRRRWASWLALAALIALVGGTVLAGASAAVRTNDAFPDFLAKYGFDGEVYSTTPTVLPKVAALPIVRKVVTTSILLDQDELTSGQVISATPSEVLPIDQGTLEHVAKLAAGRLATAPDEVDVGYELSQHFGVHVGSTIVIPFYDDAQRAVVLNTSGTPVALGPRVRFHVVGVLASVVDFPSTTPSYTIWVDQAFVHGRGRSVLALPIGFVRLRGGTSEVSQLQYDVNHLTSPQGFGGIELVDDLTSAVESSIHPQVVGWWLFTLLAGLAGLALVAQALSRQSLVQRDTYPPMTALGMRPAQLVGIGLGRAAVVGAAGAAGAVALATLVSPLTPVGEARVAEPSLGFVVEPALLAVGALVVLVLTVLLGALPAWRDAQVLRQRGRVARAAPPATSRLAALLARAGAGVSAVIGVRHALERGRGRSSVPVATALVGTTAAVVALVATSVFGASLSTLLATPRLYGEDFQVVLGGVSYGQAAALARHAEHDPGIERVSYAQGGKGVSVNGHYVQATVAIAGKGPLIFSVVSGREPSGLGEVGLGTQTMREVGASVGSTVRVTIIAGNHDRSRTSTMRVVGALVFPPAIGVGGLGDGAVVTLPSALAAACGAGPSTSACRAAVVSKVEAPVNTSWGVAVRVAPDAQGRAVEHQLLTRYADVASTLSVPTNLVNFGQAVSFPLLLGVTLAVFGAATLAHLLVASASRRRREFAQLKVLGFLQRQIRATVGWQATTVAIVGVVVGVPVGVAVGGAVWRAYATDLGAIPETVVEVGAIVAICVGVLVVGNLMAVLPAAVAARTRPAELLREE